MQRCGVGNNSKERKRKLRKRGMRRGGGGGQIKRNVEKGEWEKSKG